MGNSYSDFGEKVMRVFEQSVLRRIPKSARSLDEFLGLMVKHGGRRIITKLQRNELKKGEIRIDGSIGDMQYSIWLYSKTSSGKVISYRESYPVVKCYDGDDIIDFDLKAFLTASNLAEKIEERFPEGIVDVYMYDFTGALIDDKRQEYLMEKALKFNLEPFNG